MKKRGRVTVEILGENGTVDRKNVSWEEGDTLKTLRHKIGIDDDAAFFRLEKTDASILEYAIEHCGGIIGCYHITQEHIFGEQREVHVPVDTTFSIQDFEVLERVVKVGGELIYATKDDTGNFTEYGRYIVKRI